MARTKKEVKAKEPIRLRAKQLSNGNQSLYLDLYRNGKREYEFLKLYLIPENAESNAKQRNDETLAQAMAIKAQRILELTNKEAGLKTKKDKVALTDWLRYFKSEKVKTDNSLGKSTVIDNICQWVTNYSGNKTTLSAVDVKFCKGFIEYLADTYQTSTGKKLASNTVKTVIAIFSSALNSAVREGYIEQNPLSIIARSGMIKAEKKQRVYLTFEEVEKLKVTPCKHDTTKQAFLFSCYCGLRVSDIRLLTWKNIETANGKTVIALVQKKTKEPLYLPLSNTATAYLPERNGAELDEPVFDVKCSRSLKSDLEQWAKDAQINKHITFHSARHTFATSLLTMGADLYTTSKLLGHTDVKTTQIYAKIVDEKKSKAMSLFDSFTAVTQQ